MKQVVETALGKVSVLRQTGAGGRPLVLLHGVGTASPFWEALLQRLPERPALAWDAPGYGLSEPIREPFGAGEMLDRLAGLLDYLDLDDVHLVGHSWGALMAALFAVQHADRTATVALVNPARGAGKLAAHDRDAWLQARLAPVLELGAARLAEVAAPRLVAASATSTELLAEVVRLGLCASNDGMVAAYNTMANVSLMETLPAIKCPVLVIAGGEDEISGPSIGEELASIVPEASIVTLESCGHMAPVEKTSETAAALEIFWEQADAARLSARKQQSQ